jgi:hypothetical protein
MIAARHSCRLARVVDYLDRNSDAKFAPAPAIPTIWRIPRDIAGWRSAGTFDGMLGALRPPRPADREFMALGGDDRARRQVRWRARSSRFALRADAVVAARD